MPSRMYDKRMLHIVAILAVLLVSSNASALEGKTDDNVNSVGYQLMSDLGAVPKGNCPYGIAQYGDFSVLICGRIGKEFRRDHEELKHRIDASLSASIGNELEDYVEWNSRGKLHRRPFAVGVISGSVTVNQKSRDIVFQYPLQFDSCVSTLVPQVREIGATAPKRIEESIVQPNYPEKARIARANAAVSIEAIIRADGTIGELCVQKVSKPGMEFDKEAIKAVQQWRYEPATLDGKPIAVRIHIVVSFNLP